MLGLAAMAARFDFAYMFSEHEYDYYMDGLARGFECEYDIELGSHPYSYAPSAYEYLVSEAAPEREARAGFSGFAAALDLVADISDATPVSAFAVMAASDTDGLVTVETVTTFAFDERNNRISRTVTGVETYTVTYVYDLNNRLLQKTRTGSNPSVTTFTYDANGNQLTQTTGNSTMTLHYDVFNHLVRVVQGNMVAVYDYRADGLRNSKVVNGHRTTHVWDRGSIILEMNGSGAVVNRFSRGLGHLIHSEHHGFYLFNVRTDVVQRVDNDGNVIHTYRYDAFGNQLNGDETNTNPFRFAAEYYDWETGFIYLRARYYNPAIGRFISEDPHWTIRNMQSSVAAILQSSNLFVYAINNPVRFIDPSGLRIRLAGTSADQQVTLSYMRRLTDHGLGVDSSGYVYISRIHDGVENFPSANTLISRMIAHRHTVDVNLASGETENTFRAHDPVAAGTPGVGSGGVAIFNPTLNVYTEVACPATGFAFFVPRPAEIGLVHELIHGDRAQRGVMISPVNRARVDLEIARAQLSPLRLTHGPTFTYNHWTFQEELATIGIIDYRGRDFNRAQPTNITENMVRSERALPRRLSHRGNIQ